jgi:serine/threonine protein kinase
MPRKASAATLFAELSSGGDLDSWTEAEWRRVLIDLPMDGMTFAARFDRNWDQHARTISERLTRTPNTSALYGFLGLLLLTIQSLRHSEQYRSQGEQAPGHDCESVCRPLTREPAVRDAIRRLYHPVDEVDAAREWSNLDFDTLEFHRHGTTSFILSGRPRTAVQGQLPAFALKCIVYPYLKLPTIGRATRRYAADFGVAGKGDVRHLVRVWASCESWILMDFVDGRTLAEVPAGDEARSRQGELRLDRLGELGHELFRTMEELERCGLHHGDLSPSNIIVTSTEDDSLGTFKLVDFGVNYLYTHALTGPGGPDAGYLAPEVRSGADDTVHADLYSVGQLLVAFGGAGRGPDGTVPDEYYAEAPLVARFLEDLVDSDPGHRLLIFQPNGSTSEYRQLREFFLEELEAVRVAQGERPPHPRWFAGVIDLCRPLLGVPSRQRRLWKLRREQGALGRRMHVRWLLFWSLLSAAAWYLTLTVVVIWLLRDLNWDWGNQVVAVLQRITGTPEDQFPYLDLLRASDYHIPGNNVPVRIVCLSFAIVGARYYQGLFAGLTPMATGWHAGSLSRRAVAAETMMRAGALVPAVLILPATLIQARWWPILTGLGMVYLFLANWSAHAFARKAITEARDHGLATVPRGAIPGLDSFAQWVPTSFVYAISVSVIGILIYDGTLADWWLYAVAAATVNVALFYTIKLGHNLAYIRAGLARACLAAERIQFVTGRAGGAQNRRF